MQVIDNFLPKEEFEKLRDTIITWDFPFYFNHKVASEDSKSDDFYFIHNIYIDNCARSNFFVSMQPLLNKLQIQFLNRIKVNCYPRTESLITHDSHTDMDIPHKGAIYSLNTCNGGTYIGDTFVPSVGNRILLFDPSKPHQSTNCTDKQARFNINMNYR
tara:strand:+ start:653 stop:1129 length:477 start_codon:yes stop_codon:yes gene_type:complete